MNPISIITRASATKCPAAHRREAFGINRSIDDGPTIGRRVEAADNLDGVIGIAHLDFTPHLDPLRRRPRLRYEIGATYSIIVWP